MQVIACNFQEVRKHGADRLASVYSFIYFIIYSKLVKRLISVQLMHLAPEVFPFYIEPEAYSMKFCTSVRPYDIRAATFLYCRYLMKICRGWKTQTGDYTRITVCGTKAIYIMHPGLLGLRVYCICTVGIPYKYCLGRPYFLGLGITVLEFSRHRVYGPLPRETTRR